MIFRQKAVSLGILIVSLSLLSACAHYPVNQKVGNYDVLMEDLQPTAEDRSDELLLVLAFSGGGTRAAAMSYGVLEALARVEIPQRARDVGTPGDVRYGRLLDEVDMISSVSGGSITAAYYALYGDQTFDVFKDVFLYRNVNSALLWRMLSPINMVRLASPWFGRSDLAAEYYDKLMYHGATFGDLQTKKTPNLFIQATDIADGNYFGFTPIYFSLICSDLDSYLVSRAVAASAAFPGAFTAITLRNYGGTCGFERPAWMLQALEERDTTSRVFHTASRFNSYLNPGEKPYIHLVDGGVADNLGLRGPLEFVIGRGGLPETLKETGRERIRRVAFIVVNAEKQIEADIGLSAVSPKLWGILGATSTVMISRHNYETFHFLRRSMAKWSADSANGESRQPIEFYAIEVAFNTLHDENERQYFSSIPTSFNLSDEQVEQLIDAAGRILYESKTFQNLVSDLDGEIPQIEPMEPTQP